MSQTFEDDNVASYSWINAYCPHCIVRLPERLFQYNFNLGNLKLSSTSLSKFSVYIRHMKLLSNLDLSNNQLEELDLETRNALDQLPTDTLIVRLIGNDLKCCCKKLEILMDAQFKKSSFHENEKLYLFIWEKCDFSFVNLDKIIEKLEKIVFSYTYTRIILLMTTFIIVIIMITISRILYRLWRKLRYMYYMWLRGNTKLKPMR